MVQWKKNARLSVSAISSAIVGVAILYLALLLSGCRSNTGIDDNILYHQQQIARLEEELRNRDRAIEDGIRGLEAITTRSESMEGTIDELIELFAEYQRRVEQLIREYNMVRETAEISNNILLD